MNVDISFPVTLIFLVFFSTSILAPIDINSLTKSNVSGSIDAFSMVVVPRARHAAMMVFCVAPTETFGNTNDPEGAVRPGNDKIDLDRQRKHDNKHAHRNFELLKIVTDILVRALNGNEHQEW